MAGWVGETPRTARPPEKLVPTWVRFFRESTRSAPSVRPIRPDHYGLTLFLSHPMKNSPAIPETLLFVMDNFIAQNSFHSLLIAPLDKG